MKRLYRVQSAAMVVGTVYVVAESEAEAAEQVRECPLTQLLPEATIQGAVDKIEASRATWEQAAKDGWLDNSPFVFDALCKAPYYFALDDDTVEDWLIAIEEAEAADERVEDANQSGKKVVRKLHRDGQKVMAIPVQELSENKLNIYDFTKTFYAKLLAVAIPARKDLMQQRRIAKEMEPAK